MTWNEEIQDDLTEHQVDLMRYAAATSVAWAREISKTDAQIKAMIAAAELDAGSWAELQRLRAEIAEIRRAAWQQVAADLEAEMQALALQERQALPAIYASASAGAMVPIPPSTDMMRAIVTDRPFEGRVLREWAQKMEADDIARLHSSVQLGMASGLGPREIASRVAGPGGVTSVARRDLESVVRTATNHIAAQAQAEFAAANDAIKKEMYVATLDSRTTIQCASNDGKIFDVGEGPVPPLHYNCRSRRIGWIDGAVLGERPYVQATEREVTEAYGSIQGKKPAFSTFRRKWYREAAGSVPASTDYATWLKSRPASFQDDVLGPTRGKLFRQGSLALDKFVARSGDTVTLADLAAKNAAAFERANLDPKDYL